MPYDARKVSSALHRKGFSPRQNDHTFFQLIVDGKDETVANQIGRNCHPRAPLVTSYRFLEPLSEVGLTVRTTEADGVRCVSCFSQAGSFWYSREASSIVFRSLSAFVIRGHLS